MRLLRREGFDRVVAGDTGPMFSEDCLAVGFAFNEPDGLEVGRGKFEASFNPANTAEEGADIQRKPPAMPTGRPRPKTGRGKWGRARGLSLNAA